LVAEAKEAGTSGLPVQKRRNIVRVVVKVTGYIL